MVPAPHIGIAIGLRHPDAADGARARGQSDSSRTKECPLISMHLYMRPGAETEQVATKVVMNRVGEAAVGAVANDFFSYETGSNDSHGHTIPNSIRLCVHKMVRNDLNGTLI